MNGQGPEAPENQFTDILAAGDDALAAGQAPVLPLPGAMPTALEPQLKRGLAYAQFLRQVLGPATLREGPQDTPPVADLPWTSLGRFQIRGELGRGGFGIVFLAFDPRLGREVALKVPRAEGVVTPELRERFQREARTAAGLDHP